MHDCGNIKRKQREVAFMKNPKVTKEKRDKWVQVMENVLMSSEESCNDGDTIIVHPLPWQSEWVTRMFHGIDNNFLKRNLHRPSDSRGRAINKDSTRLLKLSYIRMGTEMTTL